MIKDYYKTLNINRDSSQDDIKKAFRKLSKQHHPDIGGDETVFKELSEAYDTLSNPEKKQRYDMGGHNPFGGHQRGHNPFANRGGSEMDEMFRQMFGGNQQQRVNKGRNLNIPLRVDLEDIYFSRIKKLRYKKNINCPTCVGAGGESVVCTTCNGVGHIEKVAGNAFFRQVQRHPCHSCAGKGKIVIKPCLNCNGKGGRGEERLIDFTIPTNLATGQSFIYKGGGDEIHQGQSGDLLIEVVINPHQHFKLLGNDLIYEPKTPIMDMIIGGTIEIPHFEKTIRINIPPLSDITRNFSVGGKGMKTQNRNAGNLIIKPQIVMPKELHGDEIRMLESLSEGKNFKIKK
eukprot:SAG11_NODE_62_length_19006_cov_6.513143_28_plen_345_part_00